MEARVKASYTPAVRAAVAACAGSTPEAMRDVGGFEAFVHAVERSEGTIYVKATWDGRRTEAQLLGELAFVEHLANHGAPVARPARLADQRLVARVEAQDCAFLVTAFEEAPGEIRTRDDWTEAHFVAWGRLVGQLHAAARDYVEPPGTSRPAWQDEHRELEEVVAHEGVLRAYGALHDRLLALPVSPATFGMCHTDLHRGNVHWQGLEPTAFDFDDGVRFWFASDLAIVLYYALIGPVFGRDDRQASYAHLLRLLREGYERAHTLPEEAWASIPLLMQLRECVLWIVIKRSIPPERVPPEMAERLETSLQRILRGEPAHGLRI